jgi:hypothetical protein
MQSLFSLRLGDFAGKPEYLLITPFGARVRSAGKWQARMAEPAA